MWQGTSLCAQCLTGEAGVNLHPDVDLSDKQAVSSARLQVMDDLRSGVHRNTPVAGY